MERYIIEYLDEFYNVLRRAHVACASYGEALTLARDTVQDTPRFWGARVLMEV